MSNGELSHLMAADMGISSPWLTVSQGSPFVSGLDMYACTSRTCPRPIKQFLA